LDWSHLT